jgi:hypothetical protein
MWLLSGNRYGFVNQHYRYIIFYRIHEFTGITYKTVLRVSKLDISLTFRTAQYVKQFFADRHISPHLYNVVRGFPLDCWLEYIAECRKTPIIFGEVLHCLIFLCFSQYLHTQTYPLTFFIDIQYSNFY